MKQVACMVTHKQIYTDSIYFCLGFPALEVKFYLVNSLKPTFAAGHISLPTPKVQKRKQGQTVQASSGELELRITLYITLAVVCSWNSG